MNEEHNQRLSATVDKLLSGQIFFWIFPLNLNEYICSNLNYSFLYSESNERLQVHLKERMHSLEEKNHLSNELERTKKKLEESTESKARTDAQLSRLRKELNIKTVMGVLADPSAVALAAQNIRYTHVI